MALTYGISFLHLIPFPIFLAKDPLERGAQFVNSVEDVAAAGLAAWVGTSASMTPIARARSLVRAARRGIWCGEETARHCPSTSAEYGGEFVPAYGPWQ